MIFSQFFKLFIETLEFFYELFQNFQPIVSFAIGAVPKLCHAPTGGGDYSSETNHTLTSEKPHNSVTKGGRRLKSPKFA